MKFLVIDGCPCPAAVAPQVKMVLDRAGQTAASIYRGTEPEAVKILHANRKHTQAEVHADPATAAISNPPGFSEHELRSDGADGSGVVRGGVLPVWMVGVDSGGDDQASKDRITEAGAHFGWPIVHPYSRGVEGHHWRFAEEPKPNNDRQRARIEAVRVELGGKPKPKDGKKAAGKVGHGAGKKAAAANPTHISDASAAGIKLITEFEGFVDHVYRDSVGVETIGYGETDHALIAKYRQSGITEHDARLLLERRVHQDYAPAVAALGLPLTQPMFDALVSFVYNLGSGALAASNGIGHELRAQHWANAANELLKWDKAGGHALAGLTRRRQAERALFLSGVKS